MYQRRAKIFVMIIAFVLLVCLLRLIQIQLLPGSAIQDEIEKLKLQRAKPLKTIRGKILDRNGRVLATDAPKFELHIDYKLSSFADERVRKAKLLKAAKKANTAAIVSRLNEQFETKLKDLQQIIEKLANFGLTGEEVRNKIDEINNDIWELREYLAWKRNYPDYNDFALAVPDIDERLLKVFEVDITEMYKSYPLVELQTDDDIFTAQLEFMDVNGIEVLPKGHRLYPYGSVACQTIGWVGLPQKQDKELFKNDRFFRYLDEDYEVCGREDGIEYVCESLLRGKRGELVYDIDQKLVELTKTKLGQDVTLTINIELQKRIEEYLADCDLNPNCKVPIAAVVIDAVTGDILALVSMPVFDLNRIRLDYSKISKGADSPLRNRAINNHYPPGSAAKPLILIAGLESGKITPDEIISCPAAPAPKGWPSCWIFNRFQTGHDFSWSNNARNAIRGSCNIYFSRLANRLEPRTLQRWLFNFGYGRKVPLAPIENSEQNYKRDLQQTPGAIASTNPKSDVSLFEQISTLKKEDLKQFGIGQGNFRVTPLQVANAMATIARGGVFKKPHLLLNEFDTEDLPLFLNISPKTLEVVEEGMHAVVTEQGGTAHREFAPLLSYFDEQEIKIYGKTGSTEKPDHAWFAGFAKDDMGRSISIAVVVEGGQHGSSDAAPLARDIIQFCLEHGYIGLEVEITEQE